MSTGSWQIQAPNSHLRLGLMPEVKGRSGSWHVLWFWGYQVPEQGLRGATESCHV